jgi:hypothetical protein
MSGVGIRARARAESQRQPHRAFDSSPVCFLTIVTVATMAQACAPITEQVRDEQKLGTVLRRSPPRGHKTATTSVTTNAVGFTATTTFSHRCKVDLMQRVHASSNTINEADPWALAITYGGAFIAGVVGTVVLADVKNIPQDGDRNTKNSISRDQAQTTGHVFLGTGAVSLIAGLATSIRALDRHQDFGISENSEESTEEDCNAHPASGVHLKLLTGDDTIDLGATNDDGSLHVDWSAVDERLLVNDSPTASVDVLIQDRLSHPGALDLKAGREYWGRKRLEFARQRLEEGDAHGAELAVAQAGQYGIDTSQVERAIARFHTQESERASAAQEAAWNDRWGKTITEWCSKPVNAVYCKELHRTLAQATKLATTWEQYNQEKEANDATEVLPSVSTQSLYPEVRGQFEFIKILDNIAGEALFSATDGLFVLHLSPGDSFSASPGQLVNMTMHSKGETMGMSNGKTLSVFRSGSSPVRSIAIPGRRVNRSRELRLKHSAETKRSQTLSALARLSADAPGTGTHRFLKNPHGTTIDMTIDERGVVTYVGVKDFGEENNKQGQTAHCLDLDGTCVATQSSTKISDFLGERRP